MPETKEAQKPTSRPASMAARTRTARDRLADHWEQRLALPVILAATVSIPAVFLTMTGNHLLELAGHTLNWASLVVLAAEAVLLLALSGNKWAWIARHKWTLAITVIAIPAVFFAFAPVQALRLLRLVRIIGTLRILRANTIVSAGRILARRFGLTGPWKYALVLVGALLAAGFVAIVLVDPTSIRQHQELVEEVRGWRGTVPVLVAGLILGGSTFIVVRHRRKGAKYETQAGYGRTSGRDEYAN